MMTLTNVKEISSGIHKATVCKDDNKSYKTYFYMEDVKCTGSNSIEFRKKQDSQLTVMEYNMLSCLNNPKSLDNTMRRIKSGLI